ncbi:MAG: extracellular solute-binding protein [Lachnospiraceae bacterium]|nr:extracellular solute-binding protein [Lachnospiraceae bacterium]
MKTKKYLLVPLTLLLMGMLCGCGQEKEDELVLRIANCEEYIDEGDWAEDELIELSDGTEIIGENSMIDDFEDWYYETYGKKVRVEYSTYGTNEDLYNQLTLGSQFDLVCPSEYMILKMMDEDMLLPYSSDFYDESKEYNYYVKGLSPYIKDIFKELSNEGESIYHYGAGYMWGTMGIVYNPDAVDENDLKHWSLLLNEDYVKQVTMKDSIRDSYIVGLCILNEEKLMSEEFLNSSTYREELDQMLNATDEETVKKVEAILTAMKENAYSLETDSGKADMVSGKVVANMQWSGDAVYSMDQAEEDDFYLEFFVPEEGSNLWFDGWAMLKDGIGSDSEKQQAAEAFVNFVSRPDNVIRNMYYIGYTSVISGGEDNSIVDYLDYSYGEEEGVSYDLSYFFGKDACLTTSEEQMHRQLYAAYPTKDVLDRSVVMNFFDTDENQRISEMWTNIRCFQFK